MFQRRKNTDKESLNFILNNLKLSELELENIQQGCAITQENLAAIKDPVLFNKHLYSWQALVSWYVD